MARTSVATDNFNRASLGANWQQMTSGSGTISIITNIKVGTTSFSRASARWIGAGTFTNDQYSSLLLHSDQGGNASAWIGVMVRVSTGQDAAHDAYEYRINYSGASGGSFTTQLRRIVDNTPTVLASGTVVWSINDRVEIECEGTTIRGLKNGVQQHSATDTNLTTGAPGIAAEGQDWVYGDDWDAGTVTTAPAGRARLIAGRMLAGLVQSG